MTTFKNSSKYGELISTYLAVAVREDNPIRVEDVLETMAWNFKGGSLREASEGTRLKPVTSEDVYPDGPSWEIAKGWPTSTAAKALRRVIALNARQSKKRARQAVIGTWFFLTAKYSVDDGPIVVYSGMKAIYWAFGKIWEQAVGAKGGEVWDLLQMFGSEMAIGTTAVSRMHVPTVMQRYHAYWRTLNETRVAGLLRAVMELKELLKMVGSKQMMAQARKWGKELGEAWEPYVYTNDIKNLPLPETDEVVRPSSMKLGSLRVLVSQEVVLLSTKKNRYALGVGDLERLHQVTMSAASCLVGVCSQAVVGTELQVRPARRALEVTEENIQRLVESSRRVALGDEVLVCKGYRRAYTAHLAVLAGPLCTNEALELKLEAEGTAPPGVLDVEGYMAGLASLDAANSLNAGKVFKICPAPDVSPGAAMADRIKQIGDCNVFRPEMTVPFSTELRDQVLRAFLRQTKAKLKLRKGLMKPVWWNSYLAKDYDQIPTAEIHTYLEWEGKAKMPSMSRFDASNWKDSGLGADSMKDVEDHMDLGHKRNMLTRLLFDEDCPMPGTEKVAEEHVIKFFTKAEGHKDPARGIFSANLVDRQAQSWMERAVESVACKHPSFMIGAPADVREVKVRQLTARPTKHGWVALYYSFDISGWSAKMPAEPQRISHKIWAELFGGHLFNKATEINEGAKIYVDTQGYFGWYENTASNLEGFNGKEMTMVLVALLSLSVKVWREKVVVEGHLTALEAESTTALLFAYIDDGLSRIDLPVAKAVPAFNCYKECVIDTFSRCGFTVETSKCFPSDRFAIFLNEVYLAGRHVVHGVRAAMGISAEPTERHTSLVERVTSVATGCRGAVMAGLPSLSAVFLMSYHVLMHIVEWTSERDATVLAIWCLSPRTWGGLGLPNMLQMSVSGSGAAFEEGVATLQKYSCLNPTVSRYFLNMSRTALEDRSPAGVLTAPMSGKIGNGYMVDSRLAGMVRDALRKKQENGYLSSYAERLLKYGDMDGFRMFAEAVVSIGEKEVIQEQMLVNVMEAHPHAIFSSFSHRVEKSVTVSAILGRKVFWDLMTTNRAEAVASVAQISTILSVEKNKI